MGRNVHRSYAALKNVVSFPPSQLFQRTTHFDLEHTIDFYLIEELT